MQKKEIMEVRKNLMQLENLTMMIGVFVVFQCFSLCYLLVC